MRRCRYGNVDSGPLGPALSSRQSFRKFTDGRITHRCVTLRWSNYGSRTRGPSVLHDQHLIRPCVGFAEVRALNSRSRGHGFDSHPLPIPLKPVKRDKATTRQSGILCGWSGRLEQSTTGHSFGTDIINVQKHAQDTSFLTFLLH